WQQNYQYDRYGNLAPHNLIARADTQQQLMGVPQEAAQLGARASRPRESKESILDDRFGASLEDLQNQIASLTQKFSLYRPDASWHGHPAHERLAAGKENASFYVHNKPTDFKLTTTAQEQKQDSKQEPKQEQKKEDTKPTPTPSPTSSPAPPAITQLPRSDIPPCTINCSSTTGWLDGITADGVAFGWAVDPDVPSQSIDVRFFIDRVSVGTMTANGNRPNVGYPGNHGYSWRIPDQYRNFQTHELIISGIDVTGNVNSQLQGTPKSFNLGPVINNATFVARSVPTTMMTGQQYNVSVTMRNSGDKTWTRTGNYNLGSRTDGNTNWLSGGNRVGLPSDRLPGETATFNFIVTAPSTPGNYNFQWQMVQD
ncbi:MAG: hypothetical protein ACRD63_15915, partial [Pyrinomonadaceae bacterium]